jgi:hypothetical protein
LSVPDPKGKSLPNFPDSAPGKAASRCRIAAVLPPQFYKKSLFINNLNYGTGLAEGLKES